MTFRLAASGLCLMLIVAAAGCDRPAQRSADAPPAPAASARTPSAPVANLPALAANPMPVEDATPSLPLVITDAQVRAEYSQRLQQCLDTGEAAKGVSVAMGGCFNAELQAQDARLNAVYRAVMAGLGDAGKARLRAEELAWIDQRDIGCREAASGGSLDRVEIPACLLTETVRRRLALEARSPVRSSARGEVSLN